MDLGTKRTKGGDIPASPKMPDESYPSFNLNDKVAEAFHTENEGLKIGDELTAKVTLKITSLRSDSYGHSIGFDVKTLDDVQGGGGDIDNDDDVTEEGKEAKGEDTAGEKAGDQAGEYDGEEKALGYKRKASKPKNEIPPHSASDIFD